MLPRPHLAMKSILAIASLLSTATAYTTNYLHVGPSFKFGPRPGSPNADGNLSLSPTGNLVMGPAVATADRIPFHVTEYPVVNTPITSPDGLGPGHLALVEGDTEGFLELVWETEGEGEDFVLSGCDCGGNCGGSCLRPPEGLHWLLDERGSGPEWKIGAYNLSVGVPAVEGLRSTVILWRSVL